MNPTLFALIIGLGNVPRARVELEHVAILIRWYFGQYPLSTGHSQARAPVRSYLSVNYRNVSWGPIETNSMPEKAARGKRTSGKPSLVNSC